ncbi:alpha/beta hydrolase [Symbioplanes lichenis]|uniref:alpha/beta hydrolase n=1 Tax=Symbioplanes lichenis TaxID=1629072 RepID=UPI0027397848|nr:alpha/beta hydrolase [Actinoplanes lichenis]
MNDRSAVIFPGAFLGPYAPPLMFAGDAAERAGAERVAHQWERPQELIDLPEEERPAWVDRQAAAVLDRTAEELPGASTVVLAKSLGTYAAPQVARRGLPAVWLTPLFFEPTVVAALRAATEPFLLVGGTADPSWDGVLARELTPHVTEIEGADHGLYVPGRLAGSAQVLGRVATAVEDFLDETVWPGLRIDQFG